MGRVREASSQKEDFLMPTKILLADDSITIQKIVHQTFENEPVELTLVGNGEAAIRKMQEVSPDLVLADIFMPGKSGYEVCEYVKQQPELASVPVILLVGAFEPFDEKEAIRVHADDHLKKPFAPQMLVETVRKYVTIEPAQETEKVTTNAAIPASIPPPPPVVTEWHAEQTQPIPLTPPSEISAAITRPLVEEPLVLPPPTPMIEETRPPAAEAPAGQPPSIADFSSYAEEPEAPLEISHLDQPAMEVGTAMTQHLITKPELILPAEHVEPSVMEAGREGALLRETEATPLTQGEPLEGAEETGKMLEPVIDAGAITGPESAAVRERDVEMIGATASEGFADQAPGHEAVSQEVGRPPESHSYSSASPYATPAAAVPAESQLDETPLPPEGRMGELDESGTVLTDEFKEFQRELVRHAPIDLPLTHEPDVERPPLEPVSDEVMGPPAPATWEPEIPLAAIPERVEEPQATAEVHEPAGLSEEMIDAIARRVIEKMSSRVVEDIAWEVVPEIAETLLRKNILEKK